MPPQKLLIAGLLLAVPLIETSYHNPLRTGAWLPKLRSEIVQVSTHNCSSELQDYLADPHMAKCKVQLNCILENLKEVSKANMASASILLGLLPVIIATLAPSLAEVALLSTRRRLLSLLLAMAAPAVFISRPMDYTDPLELLEPGRGQFTLGRFANGKIALLLSIGEYMLLGVALANMLTTAYQLGISTILVWRCPFSYAPIAWTVLPLVVHFMATVPWMWSKTVRQLRSRQKAESPTKPSKGGSFLYWLRAEFILGAIQNRQVLRTSKPEAWVVICNYIATLMGFMHIIFGVMVYSSLSLIGVLDALRLAARFFLSAIICRIVLTFEISGIRNCLDLQEERLLSAELSDISSHAGYTTGNRRTSISKGIPGTQ